MCNDQARRIHTPPQNFSGDNFGGLQDISSPIAVLLKYATCWVNSCAIVCRSLFDRPLMTTCMLYNTVDHNAAGGNAACPSHVATSACRTVRAVYIRS